MGDRFDELIAAVGAGAKLTGNVFVESLNGKFRAECLNAHWFTSLDEARRKWPLFRVQTLCSILL